MLYTHKEHEDGVKSPTHVRLKKAEKENPIVKVDLIQYQVLHPENEVGNYYNGMYPMDIDGVIVNTEFNNGTAIVTDKKVLDLLLDRGFLLLAKKLIKEKK